MRGGICMKLIVAVLRKEDEVDTIAELNKKGFFVTELATTGGFLKEKNTTLLIGTDDHKLDAVLAILKQEAGLRKTVTYAATPMESGNWKNSKTLRIFKFRHMIPVVERQMRTLTVGIGTLFDGNCGEKSFPEFFVRIRSGFREGKAFYFIRRKTGQIKGPVSGMHDGKLPVIIENHPVF